MKSIHDELRDVAPVRLDLAERFVPASKFHQRLWAPRNRTWAGEDAEAVSNR